MQVWDDENRNIQINDLWVTYNIKVANPYIFLFIPPLSTFTTGTYLDEINDKTMMTKTI